MRIKKLLDKTKVAVTNGRNDLCEHQAVELLRLYGSENEHYPDFQKQIYQFSEPILFVNHVSHSAQVKYSSTRFEAAGS